MRSFAAIDQQLADVPPAVSVLLARIDAANGRERRPREEAPEPSAMTSALAAMGHGPLGVRGILQAHRALLGGSETSVPVDGQAAMELTELVARYELAVSQRRHERLLLISAAALDFATMRPFRQGNGRMTRVLVARELVRAGHDVALSASFDRRLGDTGAERGAALLASQADWEQSAHAVWPWAGYLLGVVATAYEEQER